MKKLVIVGAGGLGREAAWLVERINQVQPTWNLLGFVDDNENIHGLVIVGYPVLGGCWWLKEQEDEIYVVCAIASSKVRRAVIKTLEGVKFATLIDPSVIMSNRINISEGCIICAGTILTIDFIIGSHVIINVDCTIGHDAVLKNFVTLYPGVSISGNTILGECVELGTGSRIIQGLRVGDGTIVGAGAVVVKELPRECTAVGCPAKAIKFHEEYILNEVGTYLNF